MAADSGAVLIRRDPLTRYFERREAILAFEEEASGEPTGRPSARSDG